MPTILNLLAAGLFGTAVALLALAAYNLVQKQRGMPRRRRPLTSMRRAEMRASPWPAPLSSASPSPSSPPPPEPSNRLGIEPLRQYVHEPYVRAGYPGGLDDDELVATGTLLSLIFTLLIGFLCVSLFGVMLAWLALIGLPLGFFALVAHLKSRAANAKSQSCAPCPTPSISSSSCSAPVPPSASHSAASSKTIKHHPLGIELGQVVAEIDVGSPRTEAFKKMAERLKIPDITALVDAIVQSEELGWPLADTLERLADRINAERILNAQATAGAAGVYVMLPSTFVLLSAVLFLFAPFIVKYLVTGTLMD